MDTPNFIHYDMSEIFLRTVYLTRLKLNLIFSNTIFFQQFAHLQFGEEYIKVSFHEWLADFANSPMPLVHPCYLQGTLLH